MNIKSCLSLQVDQDNFLLFLSLHYNNYSHQGNQERTYRVIFPSHCPGEVNHMNMHLYPIVHLVLNDMYFAFY